MMKMQYQRTVVALAVSAALAIPAVSFATNGFFAIGVGSKANSMGGAAIGMAQDAQVAGSNPAGMSFLSSNRMDAGLQVFNPNREGGLNAVNFGGADSGTVESGADYFLVPNAAFAMQMGKDMTVGMSIYGNGGMNTRYEENIYNTALAPAAAANADAIEANYDANDALSPADLENAWVLDSAALAQGLGATPGTGASDTLGINLAQLIIAPSVSYKLNEDHAIGASLLLGYESFRAYGLGLFTGLSADPGNVTNNGNDGSFGVGIRVGWTGKLADNFMMGVTGASKTYMQEFDSYSGLLAEQGDLDIPANFGFGMSFKPVNDLTLALDVTRILYEGVASVSNKGPTADQFANDFGRFLCTANEGALAQSGAPDDGIDTCGPQAAGGIGVDTTTAQMGDDNGYGFGWEDQTVVKVGVSYVYSNEWTFNAGYNHGSNPIGSDQVLLNILAPAVVENHITLGTVFSPTSDQEITVAYVRALEEDMQDTSTVTAGSSAGANYTASNAMDQNSIEVSYGYKF